MNPHNPGGRLKRAAFLLLLLAANFALFAQDTGRPVYQGQAPTEEVDTTTRPVEKQLRRVFAFEEDGVYFSNRFDGARLNRVERTGGNEYAVHITPENAPVNMSPWYAFRVWSKKKREISVRLVYPEYARHRYAPLVSRDGLKWKPLAAKRITEIEPGTGSFGPESRPKSVVLRLKTGKRPLWIAAQELQTSRHVNAWTDELARRRGFRVREIGRSTEGRPLRALEMGDPDSRKMILVISRQHPPEVTGYLAMRAFVEEIAGGSKLAKRFRREWGVHVVPLMNPDGVDEGHWRHNAGGVDLNRDWTKFNQPEGRAVSEYLRLRERETGGRFYFGIDFHSTWDDIYYPLDKEHNDSHFPDLVHTWLERIRQAMPGYEPNIRPNARLHPAIVSRNYFYAAHKMEAIVFEIGDNTPRRFIRRKGRVGARELMKLLLAGTP